jgi:type I restriction enzyme M protein
MINRENFKDILTTLGFKAERDVYVKHFSQGDFYLKADFKKSELIYPEEQGLTINERQTCNFSSNENFVVFECVHRLLEKGYKPEHIELEPKWKSGHGASGGRADILVRNQEGEPILIIECKTAGKEFDKAWKETQVNGGQLLAYADRERTVKFVCLYASNWVEDNLIFDNYIIVLADIQNLIEQYTTKDIKPLFYKDIKDVKQWFQVWNETYQRESLTSGIFEDDVQAYNIGQQKLVLKDLKYITGREMQSKFNEFAEILRKYNVSSKESAFDKLINLFLCKIVDENQAHYNGKDLEFHWRGNYADDYFSLIDRLQKLYRDGMEMYLGEKITYIDNQKVLDAFGFYRDRDATRDYVLQLFKQQKYFTNSDFGFIDVHNDKLFYQNATILLDVVKMWQQFQLNGEQQNQFLGDMFEGFLDKGFKQSEGQFFTPIPICKFILSALPLEQRLNDSEKPPRVIDYACGSGHFLTEYAAQIRPIVEAHNAALDNPEHQRNIKNYYHNTFGVEKEYRLSKVAKMSAFMYGQDEINVIYCDALKSIQQEIKGQMVLVEEESCDILIANPPFAVDGFLTTLTQNERENYTLFNKNIDLHTQRNIQCFFLERAKQLLKGNGIMGVIVPSSVLSNSDSMHIASREVLLKYFDFVSIVELGGNTFGKTGTNTVILFLKRKAQQPEPAKHLDNRTLDFFNDWQKEKTTNGGAFNDLHLVHKYCQHINVAFEDYQTLLEGTPSVLLLQNEMFKDYKADFDGLTDTKKLKEAKQFNAKTKAEQQADLDKRFLKYLQDIEQQKLYFYLLTNSNPTQVLIVKSPSDNKEQKQFLGYEWSGAKGNEGIKYNGGDTIHDILTPMFDPKDRNNPDKVSYYIQKNFEGNPLSPEGVRDFVALNIPAALQPFITSARLEDLLDFSRKDFNKAFSLTPKKDLSLDSQWELVKLGEMAEVIAGQSPESVNYNEIGKGLPFYQGKKDFGKIFLNEPAVWTTQITKEAIKKDILMSVRAPVGDVNINPFDKICIGRGLAAIRGNDKVLQLYLFEFINQHKILFKGNQGVAFESISRSDLIEVKIPLPPLSIQQQIVDECEAIDKNVNTAQATIVEAIKKIDEKVEDVYKKGYSVIKLSDICYMQAGKFVQASDIKDKKMDDLFPCYGGNGLRGYTKTFTHEGSYSLIGRQGALCGNVNRVEGKFHATEHAVVVTPNSDIDTTWLYYQLKSLNLNQYATGVAQPGLSVQKILIVTTPVPPLIEQTKIVTEIAVLEARIQAAQAVIKASAGEKEGVMKRYL